MSSVGSLREFVSERLTAAAEEIFGVFKQTIVEYEEEIDRQRRLLDIALKPEIQSHQMELSQQHVCTEEEVLTDQQLCIQERNPNLGQEGLEPPQIKEEQEELCTSQKGEELELKQETDTFMFTPSYEESDHSEEQTLNLIKPDKTLSAAEMESDVNLALKLASKTDDQLLSRNSHVKCDTSGEDSQSRLNIQMGMHTGEKLYLSETCGKEICHDSGLLDHRIHTGEEPHSCKTCGKGFKLIKALNRHMKIHTGERPYLCKTCGKSFRYSFHLTSHMRTHTGGTPYPCNTCGEKFRTAYILSIHRKIHTGEKSYTCKTCGKEFKLIKALNRHMKIHTGERPYLCKTCGKAFRHSYHLTSHMRTHTGGTPYPCNTCGENFRTAYRLSIHRKIHTGEKSYTCKTCGKEFKLIKALKRHMKIHTGERPYLCKTCGKAFRHSYHLTSHMRTCPACVV